MKKRAGLVASVVMMAAVCVGISRYRAPKETPPHPATAPGDVAAKSAEALQGMASANGHAGRRHAGRKASGMPRIFGAQAEWSAAEAADLLHDESSSTADRLRAAYALARSKDPAAFSLLWDDFDRAPITVKTAILEATGHSADPRAFQRIQEFLNHEDETLVRAAIRALASSGHADAVGIIAGMLEDQQRPISVRTEAALRLAALDDPHVMEILSRNLASCTNPELSTAIVSALGERPLAESESLFATLLTSKDTSRELRVAALESLGQATGNPGRLVMECIDDADPEIRLAAAWALGATTARINHGRELTDALAVEPHAEVRAALYSAMANQQPPPAEAMKAGIQLERNDAPRVAGLWALARTMQKEGVPDHIRSWFDSDGVDALRALAVSDEGEDVRKTALMALQLVENGVARPAAR